MVELLRYRDITRITYYRDLLEAAGIRTFIRNENLSTNEGVSIPVFFPALCILDEADQKEAISLIEADMKNATDDSSVEIICKACGEPSPANFDTCWKCGEELHQVI